MSGFLAAGPNLGKRSGVGAWLAGLSPAAKVLLLTTEVVAMLVLAQIIIGELKWINPVFVPPPLAIFEGLGQLAAPGGDFAAGLLWPNALVSLESWFIGFLIAVVIGIPLGLLMGASLPVDRVAGPIAWAIYATPAVAYMPLAKAWFGFGNGPVIFLIAIMAVFPITFNVAAGLRTTNKSIVRAAQVYGAKQMKLYRSIYLPSAVPFLFAGLRQSVVIATIALVIAEMAGSTEGVGALIMLKTNTYATDQAYAAILVVMLWSVLMTQVVTAVERLSTPWMKKGGRR